MKKKTEQERLNLYRVDMKYIRDLHRTNVKHVNIMTLLSLLSGGRDKLPFTDKDVLNM